MVVGGQRAGDRPPGLVVCARWRRHRQDALGDPDGHPLEGPTAVGFEIKLAFEGVVTDSISWRTDLSSGSPGGLVRAGGAAARWSRGQPGQLR